MKALTILMILGILVMGTTATCAQTEPKIGLRAGIGTDVNGGLAYGGGGNFIITRPNNAVELGIVVFGGSFEETTEEAINTYEETTDLIVFGVMANYLIGYQPGKAGTFFVAGVGLASVNVEWEERSDTDVSLGTPLANGGSMQSEDGSAAGSVFNLGVGKSFEGGFDIRLEIPTIFVFSAPGEASSVVPTAMVTIGMRF